ncbi:MAG: hypothetical protein Q9169_007896 [Polycauliona sp. 2 TL-2023]
MAQIDSMSAQSMSLAEFREAYLQANGTRYDKVVVGALNIKQDAQGQPKILMLKRAAHEKIFPNVFEIPGGKMEQSDATILDAVKREVLEEAGMVVEKVIGAVKPFDYSLEKKDVDDGGGEVSVWYTSLQLNFVCEVSRYDVTVNPEEHSEARFVNSVEMMKDLEVTEQMRVVVEEGLDWAAGYFDGLAASKS